MKTCSSDTDEGEQTERFLTKIRSQAKKLLDYESYIKKSDEKIADLQRETEEVKNLEGALRQEILKCEEQAAYIEVLKQALESYLGFSGNIDILLEYAKLRDRSEKTCESTRQTEKILQDTIQELTLKLQQTQEENTHLNNKLVQNIKFKEDMAKAMNNREEECAKLYKELQESNDRYQNAIHKLTLDKEMRSSLNEKTRFEGRLQDMVKELSQKLDKSEKENSYLVIELQKTRKFKDEIARALENREAECTNLYKQLKFANEKYQRGLKELSIVNVDKESLTRQIKHSDADKDLLKNWENKASHQRDIMIKCGEMLRQKNIMLNAYTIEEWIHTATDIILSRDTDINLAVAEMHLHHKRDLNRLILLLKPYLDNEVEDIVYHLIIKRSELETLELRQIKYSEGNLDQAVSTLQAQIKELEDKLVMTEANNGKKTLNKNRFILRFNKSKKLSS